MSGKFTEATDVGSTPAPAPITQDSPNLTVAGDAIRSVLESLVVTPAAGGELGTLSLGEGKSRVVKDGDKGSFIYTVPVAALGSISTDVIETALNEALKENAFFKENFDLTKDLSWRGNYIKNAASLIQKITADSAVNLDPEVKERLSAWAEKQGKENAGTGFWVSRLSDAQEDAHNRVIYPIEATGVSPKDSAVAAKDFVSENIKARKDDILKAVVQAALEADAKHIQEQGTALFTDEEKAKLNPAMLGKVGGLDLVVEDTAHGSSGTVELFFGTRKEIAPQCKDLPKDQLGETALSKLSDPVRREIIETAVRTAGDKAKADEIFSIVAGGDVVLKELHDALGGKESSYHDEIETLRKAAKEARMDWREQDAEREKTPHISVNTPFGLDDKDVIDITIPAPDGMKTEALLEGIASAKGEAKAPASDELGAFIQHSKVGKRQHDEIGLAEGEPKEPGGDNEPGDEAKLATRLAASNAKKPVLAEEAAEVAAEELKATAAKAPAAKGSPDAVISDAVLAERAVAKPVVPGRPNA